MFEPANYACVQNNIDTATDESTTEPSAVKKKIIYEQPLNERVRAWLRLEYMFCQVDYRLRGTSSWDSRAALAAMIETLEFIARNDLKSDLLKELERHTQEYLRWRQTPGVDAERLDSLLERLNHSQTNLSEADSQLGRELLENPLINAVRQRSNIPGGTCRFDIPAYHHWLNRNPKQRQADLLEWLRLLEPLRTAIDVNLYLIRNNATTSRELAKEGFFQAKLDPQVTFQIIRVALAEDHSCYPEISGGKHRFTIRFFESLSVRQRPQQTGQDVDFELCCCML